MARRLPLLATAIASAIMIATTAPAIAQLGRSHPGPSYFAAVEGLNAANFSRAERAMRSELRGAVKTVDARWVDSIIYAAGLGEALYQQGRLQEALVQFDAALDLFMANSSWLQRVRFQQDIREDTSRGRRLPAWAQPTAPAPLADLPRTGLFAIGQIDNTNALNFGGVVRQAQFWRLDCEELSRAIAWTLYRRGALLGPLGAYDQRATQVANRLSGGGVGPPGHWSNSWVELWWGLAEGASGDAVNALPHLQSATFMSGSYAHRLGAMALLAQGQLAAAGGDAASASAAYRDAVSLAVAYNDAGVLTETLRAWHTLSVTDPAAAAPPLAEMAAFTPRRSWRHAALVAGTGLAERSLITRDGGDSAAMLKSLFSRQRDAVNGLLGREADRLNAWSSAAEGREEDARRLIERAIAAQQAQSRRLLQAQVAAAWFRDGRLTPRTTRSAFAAVLGDPGPFAWKNLPLDTIAAGRAPLTETFDLWFAAAVDRRDALLAMQIIDQQRRRELFSAYPLAGRLVACRWLLEAPEVALSAGALEARAALEASIPEYPALRDLGTEATSALRAALSEEQGPSIPAVRRAADALQATLDRRENALLQASLSRNVTPLVFPPQLAPATAKASLVEGEAVLALHNSGGETYGVLLTAAGEHLWRIGPTKQVNRLVEHLLRTVAGISPQQKWTAEELADDSWREPAQELSTLLFAESRLDSSRVKRLWLVPDGSLWRAPLSILSIPGESPDDPSMRLDQSIASVAPTPGWPFRGRSARAEESMPTWLLSTEPIADSSEGALAEIGGAIPPPGELSLDSRIVKAAASRLVVDLGGAPAGVDPLGMPLVPGRGNRRDAASFARLPLGEATAYAMLGLGGGEAGGANTRRSQAKPLAGAPELHLLGALLAGGADALVVERWRPGGERSEQLVAEWLLGLDRLSPIDSWRRSLALARTKPLRPEREPRLDADPGQAPTAEHPFWWAGYYVVD